MTRNAAERIADVRRLQQAARDVIERRSALVPAIVESTGLSTEGVELALARHVEVDATEAELAALVAHAGDVSRVTVVLSANVFVGALRAVALARAASNDVVVRPSRRDPAFAHALVDAAIARGDQHVRLDDQLDVATVDDGEIHVYGRDDTIAEVRAKANPRVRVRGHGSGMGVVWISGEADLTRSARGLADDIVVFDQRGCLSPRIAFVLGDEARASELADALHAELDRLDVSVPRGAVPADERAAAGRYIATMTYACRALVGNQHAIGVAAPGAPVVLPPPYRHLHVAACATLEDAAKLLAPLANGVITVGSDAPSSARVLAPAWARIAPLGMMQRPPLDGPVDLRNG
jgi:acyl-CoA reductase-like NAD-dependent aldehyde dehydrogenase